MYVLFKKFDTQQLNIRFDCFLTKDLETIISIVLITIIISIVQVTAIISQNHIIRFLRYIHGELIEDMTILIWTTKQERHFSRLFS